MAPISGVEIARAIAHDVHHGTEYLALERSQRLDLHGQRRKKPATLPPR